MFYQALIPLPISKELSVVIITHPPGKKTFSLTVVKMPNHDEL